MNTLLKYLGLNTADLSTLLPSMQAASTRMLTEYRHGTHPKLKMLDALIAFSLVTMIIQVVYANVILRNRDPFNSYLAGVFCSLG